jgi:hypothetical protein
MLEMHSTEELKVEECAGSIEEEGRWDLKSHVNKEGMILMCRRIEIE